MVVDITRTYKYLIHLFFLRSFEVRWHHVTNSGQAEIVCATLEEKFPNDFPGLTPSKYVKMSESQVVSLLDL